MASEAIVPVTCNCAETNIDDATATIPTNTTEIVRLVRQSPPTHCRLKIESFSLLKESHARTGRDKFESTEFLAGGHTWVFSMYPDGNKKEYGDEHISVSLRIVDKLNVGSFVNATFRFFIHDQKQDNYLMIEDPREKRFHPLKTEWGISKVIPLSTFGDDSKGYLVDDCCVMGMEVFVIKSGNQAAGLSMVRQHSKRLYTWRITEVKAHIKSSTFTIEGRNWHISFWPKGYGGENGKNASVYLWLNDLCDLTNGRKLYVEYKFCIKNQLKGDDHSETISAWFSSSVKNWGSPDFISLTEFENPANGFKVDDSVILQVFIKEIFILKDV